MVLLSEKTADDTITLPDTAVMLLKLPVIGEVVDRKVPPLKVTLDMARFFFINRLIAVVIQVPL